MDDPTGLLGGDRARFESILDSMGDPLWVVDTSLTLAAWNDELPPTVGYTRDELHGRHISDLVPELHDDAFRTHVQPETDTSPDTFEAVLEPKDEPPIPHELQIDQLTDADDTVIGWVVVAREITEQVEARQQLERENQRLDEFVSVLAHDLRNHLSVAEGYRQVLEREQSETPDAVARIRDAHNRLEEIIDDVLQLARTGGSSADPEPVKLAGVAQAAWRDVKHPSAKLRIEDELTLLADRSHLRRLLTNLFRNAIEHAGPTVQVRVGRLETSDGFYVADDGNGIVPEKRERAFDWKHSTKQDGFGVGLTSVAEVCRAHDWEISIAESQTGGARFEIEAVTPVS